MGSSVFAVDQAAQAYNIYLIIYVCVVTTEADASILNLPRLQALVLTLHPNNPSNKVMKTCNEQTIKS